MENIYNLFDDEWKTSVVLDVACEYIFVGLTACPGFYCKW